MISAKCGRWSRRLGTIYLSVLIAGTTSTVAMPQAWAQDELARAGARETARSGLEAYDQKRFADALDLFKRAESVLHAPTHLLYIARSAAAVHQLILARETYLKLTHEQLAPDAPTAFRDAQRAATDELSALEPRIPKLKLELQGSPSSAAQITVDGHALPSAFVGTAIPIDPGEHRIKATAPNMKPVEVVVNVAESSEQLATLKLEPAPNAVTGNAVPPPNSASANGSGSKPTNYLRIASYAAAGVGVLGLGAGTYFAFRAKSKGDDADGLYTSYKCPKCSAAQKQEVIDLDNASASAKTKSAVGFVTGGVGIAAAVTLFVLSTRQSQTESPPVSASIVPYAAPGSCGVFGWF
jgi:hypothetical protein